MNDTERIDWLEQNFGYSLVSDDNGHFAIATDGMQNLPDDDGPFGMFSTFLVEKRFWRPTVREAIDAAMADENEIAPAPEEDEPAEVQA